MDYFQPTPQAHWQWIFSSQNKIEKKDKQALLQMMRKLVYLETQEDFDSELEENVQRSYLLEISKLFKAYEWKHFAQETRMVSNVQNWKQAANQQRQL